MLLEAGALNWTKAAFIRSRDSWPSHRSLLRDSAVELYDDAVHSGVTCLYILLTSIVLVVQRTCICMWLGDQMHNVGCKGCF